MQAFVPSAFRTAHFQKGTALLFSAKIRFGQFISWNIKYSKILAIPGALARVLTA